MSTVKIKTEPTTTATTAVDVKVKLEPSLSTANIKLEQHTSDIDIKAESDSEADIRSESDYDDYDDDNNQNQRQFICEYPGCGRRFSCASHLKVHQYDHRLQAELSIHGKRFILTRQSLNSRWPCPAPDCPSTLKTVKTVCEHIRAYHGNTTGQQQQQRQSPAKKVRHNYHYVDVDNFYVSGSRCGYHTTIGLFICHECRLVPECLFTHLQQKHGYDEKSIDKTILPESAVNASADPNGNQHTNNPHLAVAISEPDRQHHQDIDQGWLCIIPGCVYCNFTKEARRRHQHMHHRGQQLPTVPALVLRLLYGKARSSYILITRLDTITNSVNPNDSTSKHNLDCDNDDDGDELVLSDYSD